MAQTRRTQAAVANRFASDLRSTSPSSLATLSQACTPVLAKDPKLVPEVHRILLETYSFIRFFGTEEDSWI